MYSMSAPLSSERIVTSAPMSFAGSAKRMRNWISNVWAFWTLGLALLLMWWTAIVVWYVLFGLFLLPYRLIRRGGRKRKLADARHQEMLAAIRDQRQGPPIEG